jgi:hypothetical protein
LSDKAREIIREMAGLTILSGKINQIQERNLKMLPLIAFEEVEKATIDYDFARPVQIDEDVVHYSRVKFDLSLKDEQDNVNKRFQFLEAAVRDLFWKEIIIEVRFNGKSVYQSAV